MNAHAHDHGPAREVNRSRMAVALGLNLALFVVGLVGWLAFDSVALLGDAGHVLSDVGAIGLGLLAATLAQRPAQGQRTFGFQRIEILAALANGLALVVVAVLIFFAAAGRLSDPPDVEGAGVLAVGLLGLAGNAAASVVLAGGDRRDINLEAVLRHSAADALSSLGVVVAGAVVLATGWLYADPIAGLLIGVLVLLGSWRLLREPVEVLLEAAPAGIDVDEIGRAMVAVGGVREVHDLHVWTVTSGFPALAAHVRTDPHEDVDEVRRRVEAVLHDRYGIHHTTLQMTVEPLVELETRPPR